MPAVTWVIVVVSGRYVIVGDEPPTGPAPDGIAAERATAGPAVSNSIAAKIKAGRMRLLLDPGWYDGGHRGDDSTAVGGGRLLAPGERYGAASVNYGNVPADALTLLENACPIVASYGALDRCLREDPGRLTQALPAAAVAHDVKPYPGAGHGFLNDHAPGEVPK